MKGIAARIEWGRERTYDEVVGGMLARMRRRGPDGAAQVQLGECGLGQCGLATVRDEGTEPVVRDGCAIVADARIDNRRELEAELGGGHRCDGSLILSAYLRWGEHCAERLIGDFAFIIWDERTDRLVCARDPFAVRPLYYHLDRAGFRAASSMQALFADPRVDRKPCHDAIALFIAHAYDENGATLYQNVFALPAAHVMVVDKGRNRLARYWEPDPHRRLQADDDEGYARQLTAAFREAVQCRMRASGPIAVHVSGGMDSSSIACQAELLRREGHGTSAPATIAHLEYPGMECDESRYSRDVAEKWRLPAINARPLGDATVTKPRVLHDDPDIYYDPRICMWTPLFRAAADRGMRVMLTGEGGDLCLRGPNADLAHMLRTGQLLRTARAVGLHRGFMSGEAWSKLYYRALRPNLPEAALLSLRHSLGRPAPQALLEPHYQQVVDDRMAPRVTAARAFPDPASLTCRVIEGSLLQMAHSLLDRVAAAHGFEYRHPFLDRRLVELLIALPTAQKHVGGWKKSKPVLRRAMRQLVPQSILRRRDRTEFTCYVREVLFRQHKDVLGHLFADSRLVAARIIPQQLARAIQQGNDCGQLTYVKDVIGMEIWLRTTTG